MKRQLTGWFFVGGCHGVWGIDCLLFDRGYSFSRRFFFIILWLLRRCCWSSVVVRVSLCVLDGRLLLLLFLLYAFYIYHYRYRKLMDDEGVVPRDIHTTSVTSPHAIPSKSRYEVRWRFAQDLFCTCLIKCILFKAIRIHVYLYPPQYIYLLIYSCVCVCFCRRICELKETEKID